MWLEALLGPRSTHFQCIENKLALNLIRDVDGSLWIYYCITPTSYGLEPLVHCPSFLPFFVYRSCIWPALLEQLRQMKHSTVVSWDLVCEFCSTGGVLVSGTSHGFPCQVLSHFGARAWLSLCNISVIKLATRGGMFQWVLGKTVRHLGCGHWFPRKINTSLGSCKRHVTSLKLEAEERKTNEERSIPVLIPSSNTWVFSSGLSDLHLKAEAVLWLVCLLVDLSFPPWKCTAGVNCYLVHCLIAQCNNLSPTRFIQALQSGHFCCTI